MAVTQEMPPGCKVENEIREQDWQAQVQLQTRLRRQFGFSASAISGRCSDGVLVLEGRVDTFYQKQMAQELARSIADVKSVVNRLAVDSSRSSKVVSETFCSASDHGGF